ncbi:MAG: ComF family protein [Cryobacterium sp.]|nr:ComF family protein [Cryobacterium sp.]
MEFSRSLIQEAGAILLPSSCAGCGLENRLLCAECLESVRAEWDLPERRLPTGHPVSSALEYGGRVSAVLVAFKQQGTRKLALAFRSALECSISRAIQSAQSRGFRVDEIELAPVPSTLASDRKRGFNPTQSLLRASRLRYEKVLFSSKRASQKQLGIEDRFTNLRNSMRASGDLSERVFLLIDDIVTTGASLSEAVRAIESAGGRVAGCATLASTPRKNPHDSDFA